MSHPSETLSGHRVLSLVFFVIALIGTVSTWVLKENKVLQVRDPFFLGAICIIVASLFYILYAIALHKEWIKKNDVQLLKKGNIALRWFAGGILIVTVINCLIFFK